MYFALKTFDLRQKCQKIDRKKSPNKLRAGKCQIKAVFIRFLGSK